MVGSDFSRQVLEQRLPLTFLNAPEDDNGLKTGFA